jgi:hypothetical protein
MLFGYLSFRQLAIFIKKFGDFFWKFQNILKKQAMFLEI